MKSNYGLLRQIILILLITFISLTFSGCEFWREPNPHIPTRHSPWR